MVFGSTSRRVVPAMLLAVVLASAASCHNPFSPSQNANVPFSVTDVTLGDGPAAKGGDVLLLDYAGYLYDAKKPNAEGLLIDTTLAGQYATIVLGYGQLLPGIEQGLVGMKPGGFRRIVIPPELAYGPVQHYPVPANATLVYDVQLLGVSVATP